MYYYHSQSTVKEYEFQCIRILTKECYETIKRTPRFTLKYLQTTYDSGIRKRTGCKLVGTRKKVFSYYKTINCNVNYHKFIPALFNKSPLIINYSESIESPERPQNLNTIERVQQYLVHVECINGVYYKWGTIGDALSHTIEYFFSIEEEFDRPRTEHELNIDHWDLSDIYAFKDVLLESVPFYESHISFKHSKEYCDDFQSVVMSLKDYKIKIDGIRFLAICDHNHWITKSDSLNCIELNRQMDATLALLPNHYVFLFEKTNNHIVLTDLLYVRNTPQYRNNYYHETSSLSKHRDSLVSINLYESRRYLFYIWQTFKIYTNVSWESLPAEIPYDGYLTISDLHQYTKIKQHQTIELLYRNGSYYTVDQEILLVSFDIENKHLLCDDAIYEFAVCVRKHKLIVLKMRTDKKYPDRLYKVHTILYDQQN
jgi:hypothetical protein